MDMIESTSYCKMKRRKEEQNYNESARKREFQGKIQYQKGLKVP